MKKIYVFILLGWLIVNTIVVKANDTIKTLKTPEMEIGFISRITAPDLQIKRLTAVLMGDSVRFTLTYTSGKDRFLSFFNPPQGSIFKYLDRNGLKRNDSIAIFHVKKDILNSMDRITMRFSIRKMLKRDGNFIFLDKISVKGSILKTTKTNAPNFLFQKDKNVTSFKDYQDVRWGNLTPIEDVLTYEKIAGLTYNKDSKFDKHLADAEQIMEKGKNPGLGIRSLHQQGITGKGVNVAIIDQNLPGKHPEYIGKIIKYKDFGCKQRKNRGSMHAPGVLSLLAGDSIGTAPDVQVYFAAAPSWTRDAKYEADALMWIVNENKKLPKENKIKVVSNSGAPSGPGTPFTKNNQLWDEAVKVAEREGIIVLDCTGDHGFIGPCYYDMIHPEEVKNCKVGWPDKVIKDSTRFSNIKIFAPCSGRTVAEEYKKGINSYQYCGKAGLSWSIPYAAGVLAMGWQIRPEISGTDMINVLIKTATVNSLGYKIINPVEFINALQQIK